MMDSSVPSAQPAIEQIDEQPNLLMGVIGGIAAMLLGAIIWGAITYFTNYQIGWIAIGIGFLVGAAVKFFGNGRTAVFGISSALLALIGCAIGNLLVYTAVIAHEESVSFLEVFFLILSSPGALVEVFTIFFDFMDLLFYALAAYVGFRTAMEPERSRR